MNAAAPLQEWSQDHDALFAQAVAYMREDIDEYGYEFEFVLEYIADLFNIDKEALRHEWNLRQEDDR